MRVAEGGDGRLDALLQSALELAAEHDLDQILDRMVRCAAEIADARYAALGVYDATGRIERCAAARATSRPEVGAGIDERRRDRSDRSVSRVSLPVVSSA